MKTKRKHLKGLKKYPTKGAAMGGALRISKRSGQPMEPFYCEECKAHHVRKAR